MTSGVEGFALGVRSLIPDRFEAYGRILHPVGRLVTQEEALAADFQMPDDPPLRWADIATRTGRQIHPRVQFDSLIGAARDAPRSHEAEIGTLSPQLYSQLCDLLETYASTPGHCWFCLWDGFGWIEGGAASAKLYAVGTRPAVVVPDPPAFDQAIMNGPRVSIPGRDYILLEGHLRSWEHLFDDRRDSPNLFWPADRSWCVATEIDLDSTYLGGPSELVERLLADDRFEALTASPGDPIDSRGDAVNGPPAAQD